MQMDPSSRYREKRRTATYVLRSMHEYGVRRVGEIQEVLRDNLGIGKSQDPKVAFVNANQQIKKIHPIS
jgi:aminoglycoside N3'-acetyltransferase